MKRILSVVIALALMLSVLCSTTALAAGAMKLTLTSATAERGDTVTIEVEVKANSGFAFLMVTPSYDSSALTLTETINGDVCASITHGKNPNWNGNGQNVTNIGKLVIFKFKVNDTAALGDYTVDVTVRQCYDAASENVTVETVAGKITVTCAHSHGAWTKVSDTQHQRTCSKCQTTETVDHTWGTAVENKPATCKEAGEKTSTCSDCSATKVEVIPILTTHTFPTTWEKVDDAQHKHTCTVCGNATETANHAWGTAVETKPATCKEAGEKTSACSGCGATKVEVIPISPTHTFPNTWEKVDDAQHKHTCTVCGNATETKNHTWNAGAVTKPITCKEAGVKTYTCTGCGATKTETIIGPVPDHTYGAWTEVDANNHKKVCAVCGKEETATHSFSTEWSKDAKQHFHACECGAKKDAADHVPGPEATENNPQLCTICKYIIKPAPKHEHAWETKLTNDETGHWYACPGCNEKKDAKEHDFANDCDGLCETCQYSRVTTHKFGEDWVGDESGHFHACSVCGEKKDVAEHAPGMEATETTAQTCTVCNFELVAALGHTHEFSEVWEKDGTMHWHVCACGEKADEAEHVWDENGVCEVCLGQQPAEPAPAGDFPWIIVVIAVVGAAAVVVAIVLLKKKKK